VSAPAIQERRRYRYYDVMMAAFTATLVSSELIGAGKVTVIGGLEFGAGTLFFPINFLFGDLLTEVYGYARARRVLWTGFGGLLFAVFMSYVVVNVPVAPGWTHQAEVEFVFGVTPRIVLATFVAMIVGEFVNSYVLAKMKVAMGGRQLWMRTIGSTVAAEAINTLLFYPIAFGGTWQPGLLEKVMFNDSRRSPMPSSARSSAPRQRTTSTGPPTSRRSR
jgi:uncharacterized integral membrane protein (TIGR00697 family)